MGACFSAEEHAPAPLRSSRYIELDPLPDDGSLASVGLVDHEAMMKVIADRRDNSPLNLGPILYDHVLVAGAAPPPKHKRSISTERLAMARRVLGIQAEYPP